jgi:aspartyl/asparaginyl-tRNA synthetase
MKNTQTYHLLVQRMRNFFVDKGFLEVPAQSRLSILAACENPHSITKFEYSGEVWPLPQTGQMWLEIELLKNPEWEGVFCITTSYRQEANPIPGRHDLIFPMFEVETKGTKEDMVKLQAELLDYLGFEVPIAVDYNELCEKYSTEILEAEHETKMWKEIGESISLQNFPLRTNPFWNMQRGELDTFKKVDVILFGQETIGSAERSCDVEGMRKMFYSIEDGRYSQKLFELFGKDRVEKELEEFLSLDFFPRFGWGCGLTRLARAYELNIEKQLSNQIII